MPNFKIQKASQIFDCDLKHQGSFFTSKHYVRLQPLDAGVIRNSKLNTERDF